MNDLSDILVQLREVDETVRELSTGGEVKSPKVQTGLEQISGRLGRIAAGLERYIHVDTMHQPDARLARE